MLVKPPYDVHVHILAAMRSFVSSADVLAAACRALWTLCRFSRTPKPRALERLLNGAGHRASKADMEPARSFFGLRRCTAENQALLVSAPHTAHDAVLVAMRAHRKVEAVQYAVCGAIKVFAMKGARF